MEYVIKELKRLPPSAREASEVDRFQERVVELVPSLAGQITTLRAGWGLPPLNLPKGTAASSSAGLSSPFVLALINVTQRLIAKARYLPGVKDSLPPRYLEPNFFMCTVDCPMRWVGRNGLAFCCVCETMPWVTDGCIFCSGTGFDGPSRCETCHGFGILVMNCPLCRGEPVAGLGGCLKCCGTGSVPRRSSLCYMKGRSDVLSPAHFEEFKLQAALFEADVRETISVSFESLLRRKPKRKRKDADAAGDGDVEALSKFIRAEDDCKLRFSVLSGIKARAFEKMLTNPDCIQRLFSSPDSIGFEGSAKPSVFIAHCMKCFNVMDKNPSVKPDQVCIAVAFVSPAYVCLIASIVSAQSMFDDWAQEAWNAYQQDRLNYEQQSSDTKAVPLAGDAALLRSPFFAIWEDLISKEHKALTDEVLADESVATAEKDLMNAMDDAKGSIEKWSGQSRADQKTEFLDVNFGDVPEKVPSVHATAKTARKEGRATLVGGLPLPKGSKAIKGGDIEEVLLDEASERIYYGDAFAKVEDLFRAKLKYESARGNDTFTCRLRPQNRSLLCPHVLSCSTRHCGAYCTVCRK